MIQPNLKLVDNLANDSLVNLREELLNSSISTNTNNFNRHLQSILRSGSPEHIIDIQVSVNGNQEADLARNGYKQLFPNLVGGSSGTFGKGRSLWIWRRHQGTCYGRLKPIIDIQLISVSISSAMVLGGYICLSESIAGQWIWIKRAVTEADEKDAILDFHVTMGRLKSPTDPIWSSPGVGWVRVDGNFGFSGSVLEFSKQDSFLWFLPSRSRGADSVALSPLRSALSLSDDMRRERILTNVRTVIRLYVPVQEMKRLTWNASSGESTNDMKRQEKYSGTIALYKKHDTSGRGRLTKARFAKLLEEIGLRIEAGDVAWCFHSFSVQAGTSSDKYISLEQFAEAVKLTDHEVDLMMDTVRTTLLNPTSRNINQASNLNQANNLRSSTEVTRPDARNRLQDGYTLSRVFENINVSRSGILSLEELMSFVSKLGLYINEDEAKRLLKLFDTSGSNRVEESQFVEYLLRVDVALMKKAHRVHEAATLLRQWLQRGSSTSITSGNTSSAHRVTVPTRQDFSSSLTASFMSVTPADFQWTEIKKRREKSLGTKFPGFICSEDLLMLLVTLGIRLSAAEARELLLIVAPNKSAWQNGRIEHSDLLVFATSSCRMLGQLDSILERELLKPLVCVYRELRDSFRSTGQANNGALIKYEGMLQEITDEVKNALDAVSSDSQFISSAAVPLNRANSMSLSINLSMNAPSQQCQTMGGLVRGALKPSNMVDVYSVTQLKAGLEKAMAAYLTTQMQPPNLEEWATIATRLGEAVTDCDIFGVRVPAILQAVCEHLVGPLDRPHSTEKPTADSLRRDLQVIILSEAARLSKNDSKPNFEAVFDLFDEDGDGKVSSDEFAKYICRWKLVGSVADQQIKDLVTLFDKTERGYIDISDFLRFMDMTSSDGSHHELTMEAETEEEIADELGANSNNPPVSITGNSDCDWLLWFLWKEAVNLSPTDPESILAEVEARCNEVQSSLNQDFIRVKDLWRVLVDAGIKGTLIKSQFAKCVVHVVEDMSSSWDYARALADDNDCVDYESLVRFVVRMGHTYINLLVERDQSDQALYDQLLPKLKKDLILMCPVTASDTASNGNLNQSRHLKQIASAVLVEAPKFQSVLRRVDRDSDGRVTRSEFKLAMRKLGLKHESQWTPRLLQRFFDDVDPRGVKGHLAIAHLVSYIKNCMNHPVSSSAEANATLCDTANFNGTLSAHPSILSRSQTLAQTQSRETRREFDSPTRLIKGSTTSLSRTKPLKSQSDAVLRRLSEAASRAAIAGRPFLSMCTLVDTSCTGTITVEELAIVAKMIDCVLSKDAINVLLEIIPSSVAVRMTGSVDYQQLNTLMNQQTSANEDLNASRTLGSSWQTTDLQQQLRQSQTRLMNETDGRGSGRLASSGTFGQFSNQSPSPSPTRYFDQTSIQNSTGIHSQSLRNSQVSQGMSYSESPRMNPMHERVISAISDIIHQRSATAGAHYSFRRQCESLDSTRTGLLPMYRFQSVLADLGVALTVADSQVLSTVYGCLELPNHLNYESFCRDVIDNYGFSGTSPLQPVYSSGQYNHTGSLSQQEQRRHQTSPNKGRYQSSSISHAPTATTAPVVVSISQNPRVLNKLKELQASGMDLRRSFAAYDTHNTGLIDLSRFREVIQRLQLLSSEHQIKQAVTQFASLHNRNLVAYDDFCDSLDIAQFAREQVGSDEAGYGGLYTQLERRQIDNESVRHSQPSSSQKVKQHPEAAHYSSPPASTHLKASLEDLEPGSESVMKGPETTITSTVAQPKLSDSIIFKRTGVPTRSHHVNKQRSLDTYYDDSELSTNSRYSTDDAYRYTSHVSDRERITNRDSRLFIPPRFRDRVPTSPSRARVSPSKVGSVLWGANTPLRQKGVPPVLQEGLWCCAVCLYMENPHHARKCAVCDSFNHGITKTTKDECLQCSFPNGGLSNDCDMCGHSPNRAVSKTDKSRGPGKAIPQAKQSSDNEWKE